jgi:soluble lytic murein transglycosylase-like protein
MTTFRALLLSAAFVLPAAPALAADESATPSLVSPAAQPAVLSPSERSNYREFFAALKASDWASASARLDAMGNGPLHAVARAELYLAKGSPTTNLDQLMPLLAQAPDLPQASQLARLATTRGATELPLLPNAENLVWAGSQPRRERAKRVNGDPLATELETVIQPLIVDNRPQEAEAMLLQWQDRLIPESRTEYEQRVAWSYYIVGDDASARRLAERARVGMGEWAIQGAWVSGLASWRMKDCNAAGDAFGVVASRSGDVELMAAGNYWAARADMMCGRPERVQQRLRTASRIKETFYGMLAQRALGIAVANPDGLHNYRDAEWHRVSHRPNVKAAIALAEIGENALADQLIKHQAKIGGSADHHALIHLADDLNLASTQYFLAHNAPRGASINFAARYPMPDWQPSRGWRVDKALAFAHTLQESSFRTHVVSPAGATGLMQVRPGTAGDIARRRGEPFSPSQLTDPASNLEFGQSYLEYLRDYYATGGLLPKVIAAYNAGPAPVAEWNSRAMDKGDPLLYIESIPYWETRGYVPIVLRNYWIYEQKAGREAGSRTALAQGMWPRFPGMPGASAVRLDERQRTAAYNSQQSE